MPSKKVISNRRPPFFFGQILEQISWLYRSYCLFCMFIYRGYASFHFSYGGETPHCPPSGRSSARDGAQARVAIPRASRSFWCLPTAPYFVRLTASSARRDASRRHCLRLRLHRSQMRVAPLCHSLEGLCVHLQSFCQFWFQFLELVANMSPTVFNFPLHLRTLRRFVGNLERFRDTTARANMTSAGLSVPKRHLSAQPFRRFLSNSQVWRA